MEITNIEQELIELEQKYQAYRDELHSYQHHDSDYAALMFEMNMVRLHISYICQNTYQGGA